MPDADIKITYEVLFELLRRERNRDELQELSPSFYSDVERYVREKQEMRQRFQENGNALEAEKITVQILNTEKLFNELNERREKKVLLHALYQSKSRQSRSLTKNMLPPEAETFNGVLEVLRRTRESILAMRKAAHEQQEKGKGDKDKRPETTDASEESETSGGAEGAGAPETTGTDEQEMEKDAASGTQESPGSPTPTSNGGVKVLVTQNIEAFVGPELEEYGPFKQGETRSLPKEIADLLVSKGQARMDS